MEEKLAMSRHKREIEGVLEDKISVLEMENGKLEAEIVKLGAMHMQELGQY